MIKKKSDMQIIFMSTRTCVYLGNIDEEELKYLLKFKREEQKRILQECIEHPERYL